MVVAWWPFQQALLLIGGYGSPLKCPQQLAQYDVGEGFIVLSHTNFHQLHSLGTGELKSVVTCAVCVCLRNVCVRVVDCCKDEGQLRW